MNTVLESKVIQCISEGDEFNEVASECLETIADECKISLNQAKGVIGSLIKKGLVLDYTEYPNGMTAYCLVSDSGDWCNYGGLPSPIAYINK